MAFPHQCRKRIFTFVILVGCLVGYILQSREVCRIYFAYETTSWIELMVSDDIPVPSLSLCIRYVDILNRTDHYKYGIGEIPPTTLKDIYAECSKLTIKQLFELTTPGDETIDKCHIRSDDMLELNTFYGKDCLTKVTVKKYYTQEFMCYMYSMKNDSMILSIPKVAHSLHYSTSSYVLELKNLSSAAFGELIISPKDVLPLTSRELGKIVRMSQTAGKLDFNLFNINYRIYKMQRLPPPYQTMCTDSETAGWYWCSRNCRIEEMKKIKRFPSTEMTLEAVDLKHSNTEDFANETIRAEINRIMKFCKAKCSRQDCIDWYSGTSVLSYKMPERDMLDFRVNVPESANVFITLQPKMNLVDFVVYMSSCLGIWFGWSVWSLSTIRIGKLLPAKGATPKQCRHCTFIVKHVKRREELISRRFINREGGER